MRFAFCMILTCVWLGIQIFSVTDSYAPLVISQVWLAAGIASIEGRT